MSALRLALARRLAAAPELLDATPAGAQLARGIGARIVIQSTNGFGHQGAEKSISPAAIYLASLAPGSRPAIRSALAQIAGLLTPPRDPQTLPWHELRYRHTAAIRAALAARYAPATANRALSALRGVLRACRRLGLLSADDERAAGDVAPVRGSRLPAGRALALAELAALLRACAADAGPAGRRDAALLAVGYGAGLRRAELVGLDLADYDRAEGALTIRRGKGNKERRVYLPPDAGRLLDVWLRRRRGWAGPIFVALARGPTVLRRRLAPATVARILQARAAQAGVAACTPHDLRRSCISDLLDAGEDLATVQRLAGHASPETTARYDRRGDAALKRAAGRLRLG
jgi:integrase